MKKNIAIVILIIALILTATSAFWLKLLANDYLTKYWNQLQYSSKVLRIISKSDDNVRYATEKLLQGTTYEDASIADKIKLRELTAARTEIVLIMKTISKLK